MTNPCKNCLEPNPTDQHQCQPVSHEQTPLSLDAVLAAVAPQQIQDTMSVHPVKQEPVACIECGRPTMSAESKCDDCHSMDDAAPVQQAEQEPVAFDENNLPISKKYPAMPMTEHFCFCGNEISLQMVSGGTAPEGLYGRVTLKVGDRYVDYYAAPVSAKREWADLTDDEILEAVGIRYAEPHTKHRILQDANAAIAAFKEKNA